MISCILCLQMKDVRNEAITIVDGNASCLEHIIYLEDNTLAQAVLVYEREERK
jgi:hypothetical protein